MRRIRIIIMACTLSLLLCLVASEIMGEEAGKGLTVVVHPSSSDELVAFTKSRTDLVHGLVADQATLISLNNTLLKSGSTGPITLSVWDGKEIPFVSNTVNIIVIKEAEVSEEMQRVLSPYGRVLNTTGKELWKKPWPKEIDEWTHYRHKPSNNSVAQDMKIGAPRRIKWIAGPHMSRHHDHLPSLNAMVSSQGRVFSIYDEGPTTSILFPSEWKLIARDAFNGAVLWKKDIAEWHPHLWPLKSMPATLPRRLVSVGEEVFVTLGIAAPITQLSAKDGSVTRVLAGSERCEEILVTDDLVLALCLTGKGPLDDLVDDARGKKMDPRATKFPKVQRLMAGVLSPYWLHADRRLIAYDRKSGVERWRQDGKFAPLTLACDAKRVYFHNSKAIEALSTDSGKKLWTSPEIAVWEKYNSWFGASLVIYEDVVLFAGGDKMVARPTGTFGARDSMSGFSALDGKKLWTAEHLASGYRSPEDLFVVQGLVWAPDSTGRTKHTLKGVDPKTGKVVREVEVDFKAGFHHRCHAGRATEKYMILGKIGINTVDFKNGEVGKDNWVRGGCGYGIMPANGLLYSTPDPCNCSPEAKMDGFVALAAANPQLKERRLISAKKGFFEKGASAQDIKALDKTADGDWPTFRADANRSGSTNAILHADLKSSWSHEIGGKLSAPVAAAGKVFLTSVNKHAVYAIDAASGQRVWSYVAGGRVDSPPTVIGQLIFFGSADGSVTCLRASDGQLQWRRRLAPNNDRIVNDGRVESVWPVQGAVLYHNKLIYAVAGRNMYTDGGSRMFSLEPISGKIVNEVNFDLNGEFPKGLNKGAVKPDILSADGDNIFMRSRVFSLDCQWKDVKVRHLFASNGYLNDTWFDRAFWSFSVNFVGGSAGFTKTGQQNYSGRIMLSDDKHLYGFGRNRYGWGSVFDYTLYKTITPLASDSSAQQRRTKLVKKTIWSVDPPILVRCMVKASDRLFIAGPKKLYKAEEVKLLDSSETQAKILAQKEAWNTSAQILVISANDGKTEKTIKLDFVPVWDSMIVINKSLFICSKDGFLHCFK